jgi:hypothetical protein
LTETVLANALIVGSAAGFTEAVLALAPVVGPGADLTGSVLTDADVRETIYDADTIWPDGVSPPVSRIMYLDETRRGNYIWVRMQGKEAIIGATRFLWQVC